MTEKKEENSFFSRWSYRKAMTEETKASELETITRERIANENSGAKNPGLDRPLSSGELTEANPETFTPEEVEEMDRNLKAAEAVDLETLDYKSDYQLFFKKGVPEQLKNLAMRKLWTSNPVLANVDGLNDYDENFADPALNTFKSIWQVGKGYLTDEDKHVPLKEAVSSLADPEEVAATKTLETHQDETEEAAQKALADDQNKDTENSENKAHEAASEDQKTQADLAELKGLEEPREREFEAEEVPQQKRVSMRSRLFENE